MFDRNHSQLDVYREFPIAAGQTITEEGQLLVFVDDGAGGTAVQPSAAGAGELLAGFAVTDSLSIVTRAVTEEITIPTASPYTVQLSHSNIDAVLPGDGNPIPEMLVYNEDTPGAMNFHSSPTTDQFNINLTTGLMTFVSGNAGETVRVQYRYNITVAESKTRYNERSVNNQAQAEYEQMSVARGGGIIYTSMFDTGQTWAVNDAVTSGAGGRLTKGGAGTAVGTVHKIPAVGNTDSDYSGLLGVRFHIE